MTLMALPSLPQRCPHLITGPVCLLQLSSGIVTLLQSLTVAKRHTRAVGQPSFETLELGFPVSMRLRWQSHRKDQAWNSGDAAKKAQRTITWNCNWDKKQNRSTSSSADDKYFHFKTSKGWSKNLEGNIKGRIEKGPYRAADIPSWCGEGWRQALMRERGTFPAGPFRLLGSEKVLITTRHAGARLGMSLVPLSKACQREGSTKAITQGNECLSRVWIIAPWNNVHGII